MENDALNFKRLRVELKPALEHGGEFNSQIQQIWHSALESASTIDIMDEVRSGDTTAVRDKLEQGAFPDGCLNPRTASGRAYDITPLHMAAGIGDTAMCALLLSYGANINARIDDQATYIASRGWTPGLAPIS